MEPGPAGPGLGELAAAGGDPVAAEELFARNEKILKLADELRGLKTPLGNITMGDEPAWADIKSRIHTGITLLDAILGGGGVPRGRVVEVYGDFAHGKSAFLEHLLANNQADGGVSVLISSEGKFDKDRMVRHGIRLEDLLIIEPENLQQGFYALFALLNKLSSSELRGVPVCVGWDTISNAPTEAELASIIEKTKEKADKAKYGDGMADRARDIRRQLRGLTNFIAQLNCAVIFVSQTIANIDNTNRYAPKTTTPGGGGIKFLASIRLQVKQIGRIQLEEEGDVDGILCQFETTKSSISPPYRRAVAPLYFNRGYDDDESVITYLSELPEGNPHRVCRTGGGWHYFRLADDTEVTYRSKNRREKIDELGIRSYLQAHVLEAYRGK